MRSLKFDGIGFDADWITSFKTEADFLAEAKNNKHWFEGDPKRNEKLKELYSYAKNENVDVAVSSAEAKKSGTEDPGTTEQQPG